MPKEIRISLLGHKDHGKSTLIGRVLHDTGSITKDRIEEARGICRSLGKEFEFAFLLDSFVEEREGGFTLDTTVAQARHGDSIFNLIDVPGHKELVKNMLSGASMADAAILIVSAQKGEGLQDETKLHIYLARLLGIDRVIVAVNKMDAVGYSGAEFARVRDGVRSLLDSFGFQGSDIAFIPISAMRGDNVMERSAAMPWYQGRALIEHLEGFAASDRGAAGAGLPARMFVQDVYGIGGEKLVVGRVEAGTFRKGDAVEVLPSCRHGRVDGLRTGNGASLERASAGQNIGMLLGGDCEAARGAVIAEASRSTRPAKKIRARIFCLPESRISIGEGLLVICGPQESAGRLSGIINTIHPIRDSGPRPGDGVRAVMGSEAAEAELELDSPLVFEPFARMPALGRFVLAKSGKVAGVGIVL